MDKLQIVLPEGQKELVVRQGVAPEIKEPKPVNFTGTFDAVYNYWRFRKKDALSKEIIDRSFLKFSREEKKIVLVIDEHKHYQDTITGVIAVNPDLEEFGINKSKYYTLQDFAAFIRLKKYMFQDQSAHPILYASTNTFKAKIETELAQGKDDRGNKFSAYKRDVKGELPERFTLLCPPYKGYEAISFVVEIGLEATNDGIKLWLISTELVDKLKALDDKIFEDTLKNYSDIPVMQY